MQGHLTLPIPGGLYACAAAAAYEVKHPHDISVMTYRGHKVLQVSCNGSTWRAATAND